jgi:hypothetical protein
VFESRRGRHFGPKLRSPFAADSTLTACNDSSAIAAGEIIQARLPAAARLATAAGEALQSNVVG